MHNTRKILDNLYWVGVNDRRIVRFENMFPLTEGVAYNSYLFTDEKTCLIDTVDATVTEQYIDNVQHVLGGRPLDYLVIEHMEPDHCGSIERLVMEYPNVKIVGNSKTFKFFEQFYEADFKDKYHEVAEGDELNLGKHTLRFMMAPMVHWPEVMMSYEISKNILFSADAFGDFGVHNGNLFADQVNLEEDMSEIRRYYINIVGRHGANVQKVFKKLEGLQVDMICALHGHVYRTKEDIELMFDKYNHWSTFRPENKGVTLVYSSMYGNTQLAMEIIASKLSERGVREIEMYDVSNTDASFIVSSLHKNSHAIFGFNTYNTELYLKMDDLIRELLHTRYQNRKIALVCNQSWGGKALKTVQDYFATAKDVVEVVEPLNMVSAIKPEQEHLIDAFVDEFVKSLS